MGARRVAVVVFLVVLAALAAWAVLGQRVDSHFDDGVDCIGSGPC